IISSAALASAAEPTTSTVKPTSPSFDFKMPESRSSSSIINNRTGSPPLTSHLLVPTWFKAVLRRRRSSLLMFAGVSCCRYSRMAIIVLRRVPLSSLRQGLANQLWETFMLRLLRYVILALLAFPPAASAKGTVNVLYAGSLVNLMERGVGPAFSKATGEQFRGYAGGSNKVANEIKGELRRGDIFISANPKVGEQLMGAANGDWVRWYIPFAESPLVIGYNTSSAFAAAFKTKPWYEVLSQPGIKIGRTDPKLDPKGAFTVELLQCAEAFYNKPGLSQRIIGAPDNAAQVLPEEVLVGRFQ